jgi:hypothetical protein
MANNMNIAWAAAAVLTLFDAGPAIAQSATAQSGKPTRIWSFWNCTPEGGLSASGAATNGTITTRNATQNRCGNPRHPVVEMIYTSRPGFKGTDEAWLTGTRGQRQVVSVTVQ